MADKKNPWLRLYTEIVSDDKLLLLAFEDRWHYIALLCLKGSGLIDADCNPDLKMRRIAAKLGVSVSNLEEIARRLDDVDLVNKITLQPNGWGGRQFDSDSSTARVAAHRSRVSEVENKSCNVTPPLQKLFGNVLDTDTDTDTEKEADKEEDQDLKTKTTSKPFQTADADLAPETPIKPKRGRKNKPPPDSQDTALQALCKSIWKSYAVAFHEKYGTAPVRNATVNTQVKGFAKRLGEEGVHVGAWFLQHRDPWYVKGSHSFGLLLRDAETLRTQWATNKAVTTRQAVEAERTGEKTAALLNGLDRNQEWGKKKDGDA